MHKLAYHFVNSKSGGASFSMFSAVHDPTFRPPLGKGRKLLPLFQGGEYKRGSRMEGETSDIRSMQKRGFNALSYVLSPA
jgi:hypothetical protein